MLAKEANYQMNDLTTSQLDRQNILNNSIAIKEIEHELSNYILEKSNLVYQGIFSQFLSS